MSQDSVTQDMSNSRRDFLRRLGLAVGGAAIAGGGISKLAYGQGAFPSGYRFYRVLTIDPVQTANNFNPICNYLIPGVMMGNYSSSGDEPNSDVIYFHGGIPGVPTKPAIFRANLNSSTTPPTLNSYGPILKDGQSLSSIEGVPGDQLPLVVGSLGTGYANKLGNFATTISVNDYDNPSLPLKSMPGVYLYSALSGTFRKTARPADPSPDGSFYAGVFGDVVLGDDNSVTLVAATTASPDSAVFDAAAGPTAAARRRSIFNTRHILARVQESGSSEVLLQSGEMLPGTTAMIESFGLIDVCRDHFVAQVNAKRMDLLNATSATAVIQGQMGSERRRLLSAAPHLLSDSLRLSGEIILGESIIGPRVGADGLAGLVTHDRKFIDDLGALEDHRLTMVSPGGRRELLARAGLLKTQALGEAPEVVGLGGPVVSSVTPLTYFTEAFSDGTTQLILSGGSNRTVLMRSGDTVDGLTVTEINHGYHPAQVAIAGRVAFTAEFARPGITGAGLMDRNNILTALIVGIPT